MAIISREEEKKKSLLPRLLYFTGFSTKAIQWPFKRCRCVLYSLKLHLQQLSTGIARLSPLFPLHFCFLVSDFKMHNTVFHFFFFLKGLDPQSPLQLSESSTIVWQEQEQRPHKSCFVTDFRKYREGLWLPPPPPSHLIIIVIIKDGKLCFSLAKEAQRMPSRGRTESGFSRFQQIWAL